MNKYPWDCLECVYLGHHNGADLYACPGNNNNPTVTAVFSTEVGDYVHSPVKRIDSSGILTVALSYARQQGYLDSSDRSTDRLAPLNDFEILEAQYPVPVIGDVPDLNPVITN